MATVNPHPDAISFAATRLLVPGESDDLFIPPSAHTFNGFREWILSGDAPARGQFTFAAGELIVDMSPEAYETHNCIKTEISAVNYFMVKQKKLGRFFGDRFLLSNPAAGISTEPDASFVAHSSLRSGRCEIVQSKRLGVRDELVGSPDWILEILSRSSVRKDRKLLFDAYFRAGVSEYWLIDALGDEIGFEILIPGNESFIAVEPQGGLLSSPTFGCSFRLTRAKADDGFWDYTLAVEETK